MSVLLFSFVVGFWILHDINFTATPEADKAELQSIEKVFCDNRSDSLLVGSVISNVGFTDAASGATAITKVGTLYNVYVCYMNTG